MFISQILLHSLCVLLVFRNTAAVLNNGPTSLESTSASATNTNTKVKYTFSDTVEDSDTASTENEANKREAIINLPNNSPGLLDGVYGVPIDSYLPATTLNVNLPLPVYGVPNSGPNIIYPSPPPDIPPSRSPLPLTYSLFNTINAVSKDIYGPHKFIHGPQKNKPIRTKYGLPLLKRPSKPFSLLPSHIFKTPKPIYGPPKLYKPPKHQYVPPKLTYGPPNQVQISTTTVYIPPTAGAIITPPTSGVPLNPPPLTETYGVPNIKFNIINSELPLAPVKHYGPPEPVPHGPPHPGVPAPPTPPDIKYDGWQPIPGLISQPPSDTYGLPNANDLSQHISDLQINGDFIPPPVAGVGVHSLSLQDSYKGNGVVSDSYAAPLNTVTGSGGIVATSGETHHQQSQGSLHIALDSQLNSQEQHDHQSNVHINLPAIGLGGQENSLSVIKSVGYELFPNYALGYAGGYLNNQADTYIAPPSSSYSSNGPYPAAHTYRPNGFSHNSAFNSHSFKKGASLSSTGVGLIPPSGVYGVTPSTQYGTPLFQPVNQHLNALKINPPKRPVIFREPVPAGLIQSIGNTVVQKDASGIIDSAHANHGPIYIPPPIPEVAKPVKEPQHLEPSNLYSLPHIDRPISFQNYVHGSATYGLPSQFASDFNLNNGGYNGYSSNFGSLEGVYALPLQTSSVTFNANQQNQQYQQNQQNFYAEQGKQLNFNQVANAGFDYNSLLGYGLPNLESQQNVHDCNVYTSQPLPNLNYGVPSADGYSASISSLNTNLGAYGTPDLQASHSQSSVAIRNSVGSNAISETTKENYAKYLGESFANGGELIKSQSLDLNNIPIQGALGSYTLQIQSADGLGTDGSSSANIPHEQVLNEGLLQSILAAIEQPLQQANTGESLLETQPDQSQLYKQIANAPPELNPSTGELENRSDGEAQQSVKDVVVSLVNSTSQSSNDTNSQEAESENLHLLDGNEIALYFNNNSGTQDNKENEQKGDQVKEDAGEQQYGSYVSFKTPDTSYKYGESYFTNKDETQPENKNE